jgi:hypothetical protein
MNVQLYLSIIPEALVASMLPPAQFVSYLAVGTRKRSSGPAMFFDVAPTFTSTWFDLAGAARECVPRSDGTPKHTLYLGVYRVLEHIPLAAIGHLYLTTRDGRTLALQQAPLPSSFDGAFHLYNELCPVHPIIVSSLDPPGFCRFITDPTHRVHVPRICFAEMPLPAWAERPADADDSVLGTPQLQHLRDCLLGLSPRTHTKTVDRTHQASHWPVQLKNGFFVGDQTGLLYYPFPRPKELEEQHHDWWRSALE